MARSSILVLLICLGLYAQVAFGFSAAFLGPSKTVLRQHGFALSMAKEYIPDGMSKAQWEAIKKKEEDAKKGLKLGAIGITKFQSRSFEAWQKSGQKNLFPVDPNSPDYEKPYMQRKGGSADGADLVKKGLKLDMLKGFAAPQAKTAIDAKYEQLEAKGLTRSSPFELPWTNSQAAKITSAKLSDEQKAAQAKKKAAGPMKPGAKSPAPVAEAPKKKLFGLF